MRMLEALSKHFPGVITDAEFVAKSFQALQTHGFEAQNTFRSRISASTPWKRSASVIGLASSTSPKPAAHWWRFERSF